MVLFVLLLWMCELFNFSTAQQDCRYTYVKQPLMQLQCNPYVEDQLTLVCGVEGPSEEIRNILWFRERGNSLNFLHDGFDGKVDVDTMNKLLTDGTRRHTSILRLTPLNERDIGVYWCHATVNNTILLLPSDALNLTNVQSYSRLRACRLNSDFYTTKQTRCADLRFLPSLPPSPLPTTTPSVNPTNESTFTATTAEPEIQESSTADITAATTKETPFSTTTHFVNPTNEPTSATTEPGRLESTADITAATTEDDPSPSNNQAVVLYSILAVIAVFVAVIITLTVAIAILCIILCKKKYRRHTPNQRVLGSFTLQPPRLNQSTNGANQAPATLTDQNEEDVEYDYVSDTQSPSTENSEIELKENTAYDKTKLIETEVNITYVEEQGK